MLHLACLFPAHGGEKVPVAHAVQQNLRDWPPNLRCSIGITSSCEKNSPAKPSCKEIPPIGTTFITAFTPSVRRRHSMLSADPSRGGDPWALLRHAIRASSLILGDGDIDRACDAWHIRALVVKDDDPVFRNHSAWP